MLKIKRKNKVVNKYHELTFANEHVDTFYKGLNDDYKNHADNPLQAKVIKLNEEDDKSNIMDWVKPDTDLEKKFKSSTLFLSNKKQNKSYFNSTERSPRKRNSNRYKPLKFIESTKKQKVVESVDDVLLDTDKPKESLQGDEKENMLANFFVTTSDEDDGRRVLDTQYRTTVKIIAPDTPVEHYNTSVIQRRKLGLRF
jgi:hypothetical protein